MKTFNISIVISFMVGLCFIISPSLSSLQSVDGSDDHILLQTSFEQDWYLDDDMDFYAPISSNDKWDIDGVSANSSSENTFWGKIQSQGTNNAQYIHSGTAAAGVWPKTQGHVGEGAANNEWLITPSMDFSQYYDITFTFWSQYHPTFTILMPFFEIRGVNNTYLVKISTDNGNTWRTIADLRDDDKYCLGGDINQQDYWNMYDQPIEIPLDYHASGMKDVKIAWHYFYSGIGPAERWIIDDVLITGKKDETSPTLKILSPKENEVYFNNNKIGEYKRIVLIGDFTMQVDPTDDGVGTAYVDFEVDETLMHRDTGYPYVWNWNAPSFGKKKVTITAMDYAGYSETVHFEVLKLF